MEPSFDTARAERFAEKLTGALEGAALGLMTSVGHRTGLFDVMRDLAPASSAELAQQAGLAERYVREWLSAMTTAGVVDHDPVAGTFHLPAEHAAALTRAARPHNLAATFQWIPLLGSVEDEIVRCFAQGGGVPSSAYGRFQAVMAEQSDQSVVATSRENAEADKLGECSTGSARTSSTRPAVSSAARGARSRSSPSRWHCSRCCCASANAWCPRTRS